MKFLSWSRIVKLYLHTKVLYRPTPFTLERHLLVCKQETVWLVEAGSIYHCLLPVLQLLFKQRHITRKVKVRSVNIMWQNHPLTDSVSILALLDRIICFDCCLLKLCVGTRSQRTLTVSIFTENKSWTVFASQPDTFMETRGQ